MGVNQTLKTNHGNIKEQRKRRKKRLTSESDPKTKNEYWCIDGNYTVRPYAYCTYYHGVLTRGLVDLHHCVDKDCARLQVGHRYD